MDIGEAKASLFLCVVALFCFLWPCVLKIDRQNLAAYEIG